MYAIPCTRKGIRDYINWNLACEFCFCVCNKCTILQKYNQVQIVIGVVHAKFLAFPPILYVIFLRFSSPFNCFPLSLHFEKNFQFIK